MTERAERTLERSFERHASSAPSAEGLAERVRARVRRRRLHRAAVVGAVAVVAVLGVLVGPLLLSSRVPPAAEPGGWRWESYGGVEVQVPASWGYGVAELFTCGGRMEPVVGRPGYVMNLMYCKRRMAEPRDRAPFLAFGDSGDAGVQRFDHGWVAETRRVGEVAITVFTDDLRLRSRILGTARVVEGEDAYGCPIAATLGIPIDLAPGPGGLERDDPVRSISVCRYRLDTQNGMTTAGLLASRRLIGADAREVQAAFLAAPRGSGPRATVRENCEPIGGDEAMMLVVRGPGLEHRIVVRYEPCLMRYASDDGGTRRLTAEFLRPLFQEPTRPSTHDEALAPLMPTPK